MTPWLSLTDRREKKLLFLTEGDSQCRKQAEQAAWAGQMCEWLPASVVFMADRKEGGRRGERTV